MPDRRRVTLGAAAAAVILLLAGAGTYLLMRGGGAGVADEPSSATPGAAAPGRAPEADARAPDVQAVKIVSNEMGYEPDRIPVRAGVPVRLTFVRTTDKTCGTEVIFPAMKLQRELPLNQPVVVEFTPAKAGELAFACGMNMFTGVVVVQ